jgi:LAO/AO transport system kinase
VISVASNSKPGGHLSAEAMAARLAAGNLRALARAISLVEDGDPAAEALLAACTALDRTARRIGITGAPGAGKSTLVDQMIKLLRGRGERVAVLAIDPSSPYSGGALLGDRIRMQQFTGDSGVYIRSMASRGGQGGLAPQAARVTRLLEAAGFSTILIETVGVGQDEVEVARMADVTVLVLVPGMGDDVQSLKAGVMEIADVYAVNKSDQPGAERVEAEVLAMQTLACEHSVWIAPIVRTVASTGLGVEQLVAAIEECTAAAPARLTRSNWAHAGPALDHLGVAVKSIAAARGFYELLGLQVTHEETVEHEQVKTAMLPMGLAGAPRIELLEPTQENSTIGRFIAKRGEGLHHIALRVEGIDERFAAMKAAGIRLASDAVRIGAGGHRYFFVHPAATGGVLVELVEAGPV